MADGLAKIGGRILGRHVVNRTRRHGVRAYFRMAVMVLTVAACCGMFPVTSYADTPAVTDFGLHRSALEYVWPREQAPSGYAMFLTLYEDGRRQVEVRQINNDAVVGFRTDHPSWELSPELMWFVNMPVYIREIPEDAGARAL